jgi:hypothetical protein
MLLQHQWELLQFADMTIGLTGQEFTASQGTAVAPNETVLPSGQSITSAQGTATGSSSQEADLTGQSATVSLGTVTIPNDVAQISGVSCNTTLRFYYRFRWSFSYTNWTIFNS